MLSYEVKDMTCGHCVKAITQALHEADPGAQVDIDLPNHRVKVQPVAADAATLTAAMTEAGYTPVATAA